MHRLRLAAAARQIELDARVAREALFRFDEQQRLLDQADIAASKRKISELEAQPRSDAQSKRQKTHVQGKSDQSLGAFGFTSKREAAPELVFYCSRGCDRGFTTIRARAAHEACHNSQSGSNSSSQLEIKKLAKQAAADEAKTETPAPQVVIAPRRTAAEMVCFALLW